MKKLVSYINEKLNADIEKWLESVYNTQQSLVKDKKIQPIIVDTKKMNKPKKPFSFTDFSSDAIVKKIVSDRNVGFTVINQMIRNPKQYLIDNEKKLNPECYPYWYQDGENIYFVGLCIYDKTVSYLDDFIHLIAIESSLPVNNSSEVNKAILSDFIKMASINGTYKGITVKPLHPKMKANFIKLGFKVLNDNKEILTYKI